MDGDVSPGHVFKMIFEYSLAVGFALMAAGMILLVCAALIAGVLGVVKE